MAGITPIIISPVLGSRSLPNGGGGNFIVATGGEVYEVGNFRYHKFDSLTALKKFTVSYVPSSYNNTVRVGMAAGGAGGGGTNGGSGAGAGGFKDITESVITAGEYDVQIGVAGAGAITNTVEATNGGNTKFNGIVARGGGHGASGGSAFGDHGTHGGSGGGSARAGGEGVGEIGEGHDGGRGIYAGVFGTAGGGSATEAGQNGTSTYSGKGGDAIVSDISGTNESYCAGGGGGLTDGIGVIGAGGAGGGGNGGAINGANATSYGSGGGGGGTGSGGNGFAGACFISYPFQNVLNPIVVPPVIDPKNILDFDQDYSRYDNVVVKKLQNNSYIMAISRFGGGGDDYDPSQIAVYSSLTPDFKNKTLVAVIDEQGERASYQPNIQQRLDGTLVMVFVNLYDESPYVYCRLMQTESTDNGATWSTPVAIRDNFHEQLGMAGREIFITPSGRWLLCFYLGQFVTIPYSGDGYLLYSDDEGENWTESPHVVESPDNACYESGFYLLPDNVTIIRYWRNVSSVLYGMAFTNNGLTTDDVVINLLMAAGSSQTTVIRNGNKFIGITNPGGDRHALITNKSTNGLGDGLEWENVNVIENNTTKNSIEPFAMIDGSYIYVYYSISNNSIPINRFDCDYVRIPLSQYL